MNERYSGAETYLGTTILGTGASPRSVGPVIAMLFDNPALEWRRHGIGLLQAYVQQSETGDEVRIHVWHPDLMRDGIKDHGDIHDHRFTLYSTVIAGTLVHQEAITTPNPEGAYTVHQVTHARENPTGEFRSHIADVVPGPLDPTAERVDLNYRSFRFFPGDTYRFDRGYFHRSVPDDCVAVTLVRKSDQIKAGARILARGDQPPVPAFDPRDADDPQLIKTIVRVLEDARREMRKWS